jgi:TolB-like protein/tRNA A-37 threonylcarbamoyl transferase component Bud32/Flp pilus assembly protein TadD
MIGRIISHYKILEKLGEGGMGVVYKAEDTRLKRKVALKFLPYELTRDLSAKKRFVQEARAASALDHPNICTIHEIDETTEGELFISMACYEGEALKERLAKGALQISQAVDVAAQIAQGLTEAHEKGITHRDIKPANILLTAEGRVKILDFGLAKLAGQTGLTRTGTAVGTAAYMSPEQARGEAVDNRTDIWSLGVVIYEMITGELPFRGDYEQAVVYSILNETPCSITSIRPDVPWDLAAIVETALTKDPAGRYQKASDILSALHSVQRRDESKAVHALVGDEEDLPSIAVLPFVNMSPDPENAYFGDGLAEELINALTKLRGLRVAARTSAFTFRGRGVDIREIGRKLNVGTVLEGSVRRVGDRLRITAQLINIEDGFHIWSDRYDRKMEDIFAIQDEIAAAIVEQLEVKLIRKTDEPLIKRYTKNLDAYSLFLKGQHHLFSLTAEGWRKSFELYQQAIDLDPSFALAYAWQAQNYQSQCFWGDVSPREAMPKSRAAAEKALELDDALALAHAVLAVIYFTYDWNWDGAEREFKRVFELDPTEPFNHINYSLFLAVQGKHREAVAEARLGQKLDPLSSVIAAWGTIAPVAGGLYEESIENLQRAMEVDPGHWQLYLQSCLVYLYISRIEDASAACEKAVNLSGGASVALAQMAAVNYLAGRTQAGEELLEKLMERSTNRYVAPSFFVRIHVARGDEEAALENIRKAVQERDSWLAIGDLDPPLLRPSGPKVEALLRQVRPR